MDKYVYKFACIVVLELAVDYLVAKRRSRFRGHIFIFGATYEIQVPCLPFNSATSNFSSHISN